ncbi:MAG: glycine cleavage system aminomethyltransferase GcvT [Promethearchaeota archaeon]
MLKKVFLHDEHVRLGAKMAEFAGFNMPIHYKLGIIKEHQNVRNNVGLFDISHMGEFIVSGADTIPFLQNILTNDLDLLYDGKAQYSCICNENGTTIDDSFYYRHTPEKFRLIINASNIEKDFEWLNSHSKGYDIKIDDLSGKRGRFAVQGPLSEDCISPLLTDNISELKRFHFMETTLQEKQKKIPIFIAFTGYTGERGYEISFASENSLVIMKSILKAGEKYGIILAGLGARNTLRLEACYSLYGHELSDEITPIEAGIGFCVKEKKTDFIGKKTLLDQKKNGVKRKIVGIEMIDRGIIRENYKIFESGQNKPEKKDLKQIGYVTSGTYSPTFKKSLGLVMLQKDYIKVGTEVLVEIRGKKLKARVAKTPFYQFNGGK